MKNPYLNILLTCVVWNQNIKQAEITMQREKIKECFRELVKNAYEKFGIKLDAQSNDHE